MPVSTAPLGLTDEHAELAATARRWVEAKAPLGTARAALDAAALQSREGTAAPRPAARPAFWDDLAATGWLGLAVGAELGGEGFSMAELAIVLVELGRGVVPGPFLPTALAATVLGDAPSPLAQEMVPSLVGGARLGAVAFGHPPLSGSARDDAWRIEGVLRPVLGGANADVVVASFVADGVTRWFVVPVDAAGVRVLPIDAFDGTRDLAEITLDVTVPATHVWQPSVDPDEVAVVCCAAEAVGVAAWCVETAAEYAAVRVQFGRPIGQFQAVKHRCADMLAASELAKAAVWDAARGGSPPEATLAAAVAGALALDATFTIAKDAIQVLGGIGFTWEHDAHLFLRRAATLRLLTGGAERWRPRVLASVIGGARRTLSVDLPETAEAFRAEVQQALAGITACDRSEWNQRIADGGWLMPHWPPPWGRGASAVEQLVIDEEFRAAKVRRGHMAVGNWALPTLIAHGTAAQQARWIPPTMRFETSWCQLFSEPGAGSDLASLSTRAERVEGGWRLTGQKVWTTLAHQSAWGICLARTDPLAPRHDGITCFVVDMASDGIDIRPLRELTGHTMFNEVFLDGVFVPDDAVVGPVNGGWEAARTTLANERVSMGSGSSMGPGVEALVELASRRGALDDPRSADMIAAVLADSHALAVMGLRMTTRALAGVVGGPEASVRKLLGTAHEQRTQEVALEVLGADAATLDGEAGVWVAGFLGNRALSIAGGTSDIQRNIVAERLLGLPKDPEPGA